MIPTVTRNAREETLNSLDRLPASLSRVLISSICVLLIAPVGAVALLSGAGMIRLPVEMFLLAERAPIIFRLHMLSGAAALLLLPITIYFRHRPDLHRALGRTLGGFVVVGGLTALPVAVLSQSAPLARAGFFAQGLVWLWLLGQGWIAIRRGQRARHARYMIGLAAVTTGAVWFRLMTGAALYFHLPFEQTYVFAAWAGWLIPLCAVWIAARLGGSLLH